MAARFRIAAWPTAMLFNSAIFGLFILIVFPLYMAVRSDSGKKWLLLLASYAFYANWDVRYLPLLWISTLVACTNPSAETECDRAVTAVV